jgi:hypothetical protein
VVGCCIISSCSMCFPFALSSLPFNVKNYKDVPEKEGVVHVRLRECRGVKGFLSFQNLCQIFLSVMLTVR